MHPLCCISTVSDHSPVKPLPDNVAMPPHPPVTTVTTTSSSGSSFRSNSVRSMVQILCQSDQNQNNQHRRTSSVDLNRMSQRNGTPLGREVSKALNLAPAPAPPPQVDVKINNIVGNGISGVLYKWVNYGKAKKRKEDPKLSAKNLSVLSPDIAIPFLVIPKTVGNPLVSSIRESRSDDKRFSIFTGTKRLHLRAEARDDRVAWVEALQAVKDMFPRMSNSELMAPMDNVAVSTEKLRQRLMQERVNELAIQDSEQIMKSEFSALQNHLVLLKQKQSLLIDTLRQLETEKVDLENTVVDESQNKLIDLGASSMIRQDKSSGKILGTGIYSPFHQFEVAILGSLSLMRSFIPFLCIIKCRDRLPDRLEHDIEMVSMVFPPSNGSDLRRSSFSSDDEGTIADDSEDNIDPYIKSVGSNFPSIKRRKKLPDPVEREKSVSLWSMIKENIGKDLTKVCLPVYFNEPLSSLQKCFEDLEYSYLLDRAYEWGKRGNNLMRILNVAAFAVSGYSSTEARICKPFNPLLGETYEADFPDKGVRFFSEKVSHHPMIVACHCQGTGWKLWGDSNLKSKFWGRSIQLDPVGVLTLEFDDGEVFKWSKVTTSIYNLILGKLYCDHYGAMRIEGNRDYSCKLKFKEQSIIDRNPHQIEMERQWPHYLENGMTACIMLNGDCSAKGKGQDSLSETHLLWKRSKPPKYPTRYNLTRFAITLNELTPGLKEKLPPTDSRLRPDQRYLENGEYEMANSEKLRLEQRQRQARNMQERGWKPRWFAKDKNSDSYRYIGGYWEAREQRKWDSCPDIFGQIPSDHPLD
ncbi:hypothetical protein GOBAR_AA05873 [Gossypium barbadense]|uniref:PH domain-containing protein n=1 Tax=Gossypium barbadense TaxID=3634 RepID=A0A2P5YGN6_GOSBA|nr:hypothetical protein GOBAR_AA05873 [Gossypium barbadense]